MKYSKMRSITTKPGKYLMLIGLSQQSGKLLFDGQISAQPL